MTDLHKPIPDALAQLLADLGQITQGSADVLVNRFVCGGIDCALICCEGMVSQELLTQMLLTPLMHVPVMPDGRLLTQHIRRHMLLSADRPVVYRYDELFRLLYAGFALLAIDGQTQVLGFGAQGYDKRGVEDPSGEANLLGAHEGFTEAVRTNMSLLRRRMKTPLLHFELLPCGALSRTDVCLCYLSDRADPALLRRIRLALERTGLDTVLSPGYLQPFLQEDRRTLFDTVSQTQRPDVLCSKLLEGRVAVLVDGSPYALVVPKLFVENFQAMDDYSFRPYYAVLIRYLRYAAFLLALLLPAVYTAVCLHHPELLNSTLVMILTRAEADAPLSLPAEAAGVLLTYEIIREAGLRLPRSVGGAVSIVGGLIVGDAAVSSGLVSTPMLTMAAVSVIAGYIVPELGPVVTLLRLCFLAAGALWGLFGIGLAGMAVLCNLCSAQGYGYPATAPLSPFRLRSMRDVATRVGFRRMRSGNFTVEEYHEPNA
ncbi:MAG: spore germination protein [Oscillospiraceae bacterium]|nr:spore germination protein [Oscillospiraceae bacterium]